MRHQAAALGVAALVVLVVLQLVGPPAHASPLYLPGFPYSYAEPSTPASVGAEGDQGTIPGTAVGAPGTAVAGVRTHVGPAGVGSAGRQGGAAATLELDVRDGAAGSSTAAPGASGSLRNVTSGAWTNATTNSAGFLNLTATAGWYELQVGSASPSWTNWSELISLTPGEELVRYLLPVADTTSVVGNGGTPGTVYVHVEPQWIATPVPEWTVSLLNASSGNAVLASAVSGSNGTAAFTGVNKAYQYSETLDGYSQPLTAIHYSAVNDTEGPKAFGTGPIQLYAPAAKDTWFTGAVSGTAPSSHTFGWALSSNTVLTGGTLFLGTYWHSGSFSLTLNGVTIYDAAHQTDTWTGSVALNNCTVIQLSQSQLFSPGSGGSLFLNSTTLLGSPVLPNMTAQLDLAVTSATGSVVVTSNASLANPALLSGSWTNDLLAFNGTTAGAQTGELSTNLTVRGSTLYGLDLLGVAGAYVQSWDSDLFVDSIAGLTNAQSGSTWLGSLSLTNSTDSASIVSASANVTTLWGDTLTESYSVGHTIAGFSGWDGSIARSTLRWQVAPGANFSALYQSLPDGGPNTCFCLAVGYRVPDNANLSADVLNYTSFPMVNLSFGGALDRDLQVFDCSWSATYPVAELTVRYGLPDGRFAEEAGAMIIESSVAALYVNYSTLNVSMGIFAAEQADMNHDLWPWNIVYNTYAAGLQMFFNPSATRISIGRVYEFENDTWLREVFAPATWGDPVTGSSWFYPSGEEIAQDTETPKYGGPREGQLLFIHDTVDPIMAGAGQVAPMALELSQRFVNTTVAWDLFRNSPSYVSGSWFANPYAADIQVEGGNVTVSNTWFLNLNNESVAIAGTNLQAVADGWRPSIVVDSDHFYFDPAEGQGSVSPFGPEQLSESPVSSPLDSIGIPEEASVSYELPLAINMSGPTGNGGPLLQNASVVQRDPTYDQGFSLLAPVVQSWIIDPSVNVSSGTPTVSFQGAGGPQPNWTWGGYAYRLWESPDAQEVSVNSSAAPEVDVLFQGTPGVDYSIVGSDAGSGSVFLAATVLANATGAVVVTFDPATEPHSSDFSFAKAISGTAAAGASFWANLGALFGSYWWILVPGLVLVMAVVVASSRRNSPTGK